MKHNNAGPEPDTRPIGRRAAAQALETLNAYRAGKERLDARLIREEEWYRLRHRNAVRIPADLPRPTSAWLLNTILQKHADAMDSYPQASILPREPDDRATASALSAVLPAILERADFEETYSYNWWEKLKHGTACYGVFWDPAADAGLGEIAIRPVDLLHLYWQPGVRELQRSRNVFLCELVDNDVLDEQFPEHRGTLRSSPEFLRQYVHDDAVDISNKSLVVDWYYKRRAADGRQLLHYARLVGEHVLYATENDPLRRDTGWYEHGQYPFVLDTLFPEKDSPHGFGYVAVCMEPQTYIDSLSGYILEHAAQSARQRWWNAVSSAVNEAEFLDPAARIVHVEGSITEDRLRPIEVPSMGSAPIDVLTMKIEEMKETSANRDFSNGSAGAGVTAASAIYALQESGNKVSRDSNAASYRAYTRVCRLCLELIRQFYDEARAFRAAAAGEEQEFVTIGGADLRERPAGTASDGTPLCRRPAFDIRIVPQKHSPFSTAAANERALQLYNAGFFDPRRAGESLIALEMMEFEGKDTVMERIRALGREAASVPAAAGVVMGNSM